MDYENVLSIDLESWVHRYFFDFTAEERKKEDNGYIRDATREILSILEKKNTQTTFFIISEIYDWYPSLIEEIKRRGHEIAYHTHTHTVLRQKSFFLDELRKSREFLEKFKPKGFRAPSGFMKRSYLKIIKDWGFHYDSSTYGQFNEVKRINKMWEIPISAWNYWKPSPSLQKTVNSRLLAQAFPFGSGYFIGMLGKYVSLFIKRANSMGWPVILYLHPWQVLLPDSPKYGMKFSLTHLVRIPTFIDRKKTFHKLLDNFQFTRLDKIVEALTKSSATKN